jgi:succinyl-CoA synthetase beta subunit
LLEWRDRPAPVLVAPNAVTDHSRREYWLSRLASGLTSGAEAFELLNAYGIATVPAIAVTDRQAAIEAADSLGYPVVLKTDEPSVAHKSDVGGVILGLESSADVGASFDDLAQRLGNRVLVAAMGPGGVEIALGLVRDPVLGPLVVVAAGGLLIELIGDRAVALPPIDNERARRLIDRLKVRRLLEGARGQPAADIEAVLEAVVSIAVIAEELSDGIEALDVNPLVCGPWGVVALDALVVAPAAAAGAARID